MRRHFCAVSALRIRRLWRRGRARVGYGPVALIAGEKGRQAMRILVIYDIPGDTPRTKVADACLDYGLERIQYSAFVGTLGRAHIRELETRVTRLLEREPAKVR